RADPPSQRGDQNRTLAGERWSRGSESVRKGSALATWGSISDGPSSSTHSLAGDRPEPIRGGSLGIFGLVSSCCPRARGRGCDQGASASSALTERRRDQPGVRVPCAFGCAPAEGPCLCRALATTCRLRTEARADLARGAELRPARVPQEPP